MKIPNKCPCCGRHLSIRERIEIIGGDWRYSSLNPNRVK